MSESGSLWVSSSLNFASKANRIKFVIFKTISQNFFTFFFPSGDMTIFKKQLRSQLISYFTEYWITLLMRLPEAAVLEKRCSLLCNFIEIALRYGCSPVNLLHIFSTPFQQNNLCQSLFFNKVAGLRPGPLLKKRLWHRCFPVNFAIFLRTPFLQSTLVLLLL